MFPLRDDNPQLRIPYVNYGLILVNILAWISIQGLGQQPILSESICQYGLIPADLLSHFRANLEQSFCPIDYRPDWGTLFHSMFMHGSWLHLLGNVWFLWIFGDNVEDAMGSIRYLAFYLLCGLAAAGAQILSDLGSSIPMVGASGAIGGVMGAYIVLYPRVHVHMLIFLGFFITTMAVPAVLLLAYWFVIQFFGGLSSITSQGGGVAFWAHIGGFLAGIFLIPLFKKAELLHAHPYHGWNQKRHKTALWRNIR